jgi:hypothetical protein
LHWQQSTTSTENYRYQINEKLEPITNIGPTLKFNVKQGATFGPVEVTLRNPPVSPATVGVPIDLTGCTIRLQVRRKGLSKTVTLDGDIDYATPRSTGKFFYGWTAVKAALLICGELLEDDASQYVAGCEMTDANGKIIHLFDADVSVSRDGVRP